MVFLGIGGAFAQAPEETPARLPKISGAAPGELLVRFKPGATPDKKAKALKKVRGIARDLIPARAKAFAGKKLPSTEAVQVVKVQGNVAKAKADLENDPEVLYVEPNYTTRVFGPVYPDDFEFESLYAMHNTGQGGAKPGADIQAPEAWEITTGSRDVLVAVIDTGVDYFHEDLRPNMWINSREIPGNGIDDDNNGYIDDVHGYDFVSDDSDPFDDHFHGTHVSGTIGAVGNNGIGVAGVCWQVRIMAVKAFDERGNGTVASAIGAIHYAIVNGARIINASWGLEDRSRALKDAVAEAQAAGIIFVAAAGNSHTATPFFPAGYEGVIAVGSLNNQGERSYFSNYGAHLALSAPGEQILSTVPDSKYDSISGTSMATPHVAGAAALVLSRHPEFTAHQVADILKNTADFVKSDFKIGRGRLNAFKALQIDLPLPEAVITAPAVLHGSVDFRGAAAGGHFVRYSIAHGPGVQPESWTEIFSSEAAVTNGLLMAGFDSSTLDDGTNTFRLTVWNQNGQTAMDFVTVEIRNVQISSPQSSDILRAGPPLEIRGTVYGQGRSFGLAWGKGLAPKQWFTNGFTIRSNGQVQDSVLGTFDTTTVASNEFYSFRLSATNSSGNVQESYSYFVWLDSHLRPGWPVYLPHEGEYSLEDWRQAKVVDLNGDGFKEVIIVDHGNSEGKIARLLVYRYDGTLLWSRALNGDEPYSDVPTIADLDGDGQLDILVDVGSTLYAFDRDGQSLPGLWPISLTANRLGKVVADLDGDGKFELIALANRATTNAPNQTSLTIYDREGHVLQRWPLGEIGATNITQKSFPVVANMDSDPELEIVIVGGGTTVSCYDITNLTSPVWVAPVNGICLSSPIVADIDRDGKKEVIVATCSPNPGGAGVYVFDNMGVAKQGWPSLTDDSFLTSPAVGDLDGDGLLEICVMGSRSFSLHVLEFDGFEAFGWPKLLKFFSNAGMPNIADIDGDGFPDIIYAAPGFTELAVLDNDPRELGGVMAWNRFGFPLHMNGAGPYVTIPFEGTEIPAIFRASPLTITDLDGNGKLDLIGSSIWDRTVVPAGQVGAFKRRSSLYAWELAAPSTQGFPAWTEFQQNPGNNGLLSTPKPPPQPPEILPIPNQTIGLGQTFAAIPLDQFLFFPGELITNLVWTAAGQNQLRVVIDEHNLALVSTPSPEWEGTEMITFSVSNASFTRSISVQFAVRKGFFPPVATPDVATTLEDETVEIDVLANDSTPGGGVLKVVSLSRPTNGKAVITEAGTVLYRPATNYFGDDDFTYVLENAGGGQAIGSVSVHIAPINDPPIAGDDRALTFEDAGVVIDILANDKDPEGDPLEVLTLSAPADGSALLTPERKVVYQPRSGFNGTNVFTYTISDGVNPPQEARITVVVRPLNSPPVAKSQDLTMNRNGTLDIIYLGEDLEGDPLSFRIIRAPAHAELFSYPTVGSYIPHKGFSGEDFFSYRASDGQLESAEAMVHITILATNNAPTPSAIKLMTRVNQAVTITLNASDRDEDPLTFHIVSYPEHGTLQGASSNYVYTPDLNYLGKDEFTYAVSDGMSEVTAKISLETTDKNTAPVANLKFVKTTPNTPVSFLLTGADGESNPLQFTLTSQPKHGILTGAAPFLVFRPETNYLGPDRFRFNVSDGEFTSDPAAVTILVAPSNTVPVATSQTALIYGDSVVVNLNVRDPDGDPMEIVILKGPRSGRVIGSGTTFIYKPNSSFGAVDVFTYKAFDGRNFGNEAQVRIERTTAPPPQPPRFNQISLSDAGIVQLGLTNQLGSAFRLEATSDFTNWVTLTNVHFSVGSFLFNAPATNQQIFYRAIQE